jgi:hypothetical protein
LLQSEATRNRQVQKRANASGFSPPARNFVFGAAFFDTGVLREAEAGLYTKSNSGQTTLRVRVRVRIGRGIRGGVR